MTEVQKLFGPPGTGKTTSLISIVEDELSHYHLPPSEIVYVSFTKVAARVAINRAREKFPGYGDDDFKYFSTIHSICFRLLGLKRSDVFTDKELRKFGEAYGYEFCPQEPSDDPFQQAIQDRAIMTPADFFEAMYNYWRNSSLEMDDAIRVYTRGGVEFNFSRQEFYTYVARRDEYKRQHNLYDFTDMLSEVIKENLYPLNMRVLIADECQDNSDLLSKVIRHWAGGAERAYLAGDPYQAIYGWSGADPSLFINFPADKTKTLKQSYRCPRVVHDLSRRIIARVSTRYKDDDYLPRDAEGIITNRIDFDVTQEPTFWLFRTRYLLNQTADQLYFNGVPFLSRRGKRNIFDYRKGKKRGVVSRLLGFPSEPITLADLANIIDYIPSKYNGVALIERGMKKFISEEAKVSPDRNIRWHDLLDFGFTFDFLKYTASDLLELLKEREFPKEEKSYIRRLVAKYGLGVLSAKPNLELGTFHSVKGDEATRVIIDPTYTRRPYSNFVDGDEEEHRLIYTAITRSSRDVVLLPPSSPMYYPVS
jgi:DNA helicase-2/ATP-dependent DNA helicase PcrA